MAIHAYDTWVLIGLLMIRWDTQQQLYLNILDAVRYLVVWQPVSAGLGLSLTSLLICSAKLIFGFVQLSYYILGLD